MKKLLTLLALSCITACSSTGGRAPEQAIVAKTATVESAVPSVSAESGYDVAARLKARYEDTRDDCGAASKPAFLCSGLLVRGGEPSTQYDIWNPSPTSEKNGGVSFSFLRSDYKMKRLAYTYESGFIFYPVLSTPQGKELIEILCFFPVDGSSNARINGGCDEHPNYPVISKSCERQDPVIDTAAKWVGKYRADAAAGRSKYEAMCSFNVSDSANSAAAGRFLEGMRGGRLISPEAFDKPNDVKLKTWPQNIPDRLPIEAFFYTRPAGLAGAQLYQRRFRQLTGTTIPIIYIPLPQTLDQSASFSYIPADQTQ